MGNLPMKQANLQSEKVIRWRMTRETFEQYLEQARILKQVSEYSEEHYIAIDTIKLLPGYPLEYNLSDGEILQPVVVDKIQSVVYQ